MMNISTLFFGELEVEEKDTITFIQGVPGFEDLTRYTRIQPEGNIPFLYYNHWKKVNYLSWSRILFCFLKNMISNCQNLLRMSCKLNSLEMSRFGVLLQLMRITRKQQ
jgi:hypothetical protein